MDELERMLAEGAPFKILRASNGPITVPASIITNTNLSRHLVGVYVSLLYMLDRGIEDIRTVGMESNRFDTNVQELIEAGLIEKQEDGTLKLMEVC